MDACVDHVAALENRRVTTYTGNYSSYLKQREDNLEQMRAKRAAQERDIAHMQVFVDKFRYKPTKAAQAQERIRKIEQIKKELVILPEGHKHIDFKFPDPPRSGDMVVGLEASPSPTATNTSTAISTSSSTAASTWRSSAPTAPASPRS